MTSKSTRVAGLALAALFATVAGCGGDDGAATPALSPAPAPAPDPAPVIQSQPANATVPFGGTATFTVAAAGAGLSYQWLRNGVALDGATGASYVAPAFTTWNGVAQFSVRVTNAAGTTESRKAALSLQLSDDQAIYENAMSVSASADPGLYELSWRLPDATAPVDGVDQLWADAGLLMSSPADTGRGLVAASTSVSLAPSLGRLGPAPDRTLKNGAIVTSAGGQRAVATYVPGGVRLEVDAGDELVHASVLANFASHALDGPLSATPDELKQSLGPVFGNALVLDQTMAWEAGAAYVVYTATNQGDRYQVFDCFETSAGAADPCNVGTTLQAAMAAGEPSDADGLTYTAAQGTTTTVDGVPVWVAAAPRPAAAVGNATTEYRIYFELDGNVYTGALVKDGAIQGGGSYFASPKAGDSAATYPGYTVRLNDAAVDSLRRAARP